MMNLARGNKNFLEVIGELVDMNLEQKLTKKGKQMIIGNVDVEVKKGDKVNVIELKVLCMAGNKLYKGVETVMNEYKTRKIDGVGEKIKVQGNVELNEYVGNDGSLKSFNVCNARFFHRLSEAEYAETGDRAMLTLGGTYLGNKEIMDKEGLPTGEYEITVYNRAYNSTSKQNDKINCLKGLKMSGELFEIFENEFSQGENMLLNIEVNRGVIAKEEPEEKKGFGMQPKVVNNSYYWSYDVVGGISTGMSEEEDIVELERLRRVQLAEISGDGLATNGKGFGQKPQANDQPQTDTGLDPFSSDIPF